jgi:hypothetical protein
MWTAKLHPLRTQPPRWSSGVVLLACVAASRPPGVLQSDPLPPNPAERTEQAIPGIRPYVRGIRIAWDKKEVLVDAKVVLRQGPLELLACSPQTREHESILVVAARPLHIYQALGLVGLEPGQPLRFDEEREDWIPATGERLEILVQWRHDGAERVVRAEEWLEEVKTGEPPTSQKWIFAGSLKSQGGGFAADSEGTVVCVVDFATALIALRDTHSADNEQLWLRARTDAIPPVGTPCTLVIRAFPGKPATGVEKPGGPRDNTPASGSHRDPDSE